MTRANFLPHGDEAEEATIAEWLAAGGSPLAGATLEPMTPAPDAARPVTLTDDTVTDIWRLNNGR